MDTSAGIIKEIDKLGRIVIPKELRECFCLDKYVEIVATELGFVIRNPEYQLVRIESNGENDKSATE